MEQKTYSFLTPDLWPKTDFIASPFCSFWKELKDLEERKRGSGGDRGRGRGRGKGDAYDLDPETVS